jgi:hypothetical protein
MYIVYFFMYGEMDRAEVFDTLGAALWTISGWEYCEIFTTEGPYYIGK